MFDLPWKPLYAQSGAADAGGEETGEQSQLALYALAGTVAFTLFVYTFEGSLDARQKAAYKKTQFPEQLKTTVSKIDADLASEKSKESKPLLEQLQGKFKNAQTYGLDKINFGMISSTYETLESVAFLLLGFFPYVWDQSVSLGETYFGWSADNEIKISLIFFAIVTIVGTITSLPFELYSTFQIEKKHGFNKQTYGLFFTDKVKSLLLTFAIGGPFVALLLKIIEVSILLSLQYFNKTRRLWKIIQISTYASRYLWPSFWLSPFSLCQMGGDYFYIYVWGFMFIFSVFMMTIVPVFIMPLFNKYEPLPDGELKTRIYELADKLNYPLKKLFVMDGSKRSSHSNAFMFGFGKNKRIGK